LRSSCGWQPEAALAAAGMAEAGARAYRALGRLQRLRSGFSQRSYQPAQLLSDKKYSVFISSTFEDLRPQREAVLKAILENGHFPLGMELWGAADEQQWQIIKRQIDVADYYVVIIAHRYGSQHKGTSWTEMEYNYAIEREVPVLGFILDEKVEWTPGFIDKEAVAKKLDAFKRKAKKKPVSFWKDTEDLRTKVVLALGKQIQSTPRIGWIRADQGVTSVTANELARLSEENAKLREENARLAADEHPNLAFELDSALVTARNYNENHWGATDWRLSSDMMLSVTLKKGVPVGFAPAKVSLTVHSEDDQSLSLQTVFSDSNGRTLKDISISGPMSFRVSGSGKAGSLSSSFLESKNIKLVFSFSPIGYTQQYSFAISLEEVRNQGRPQWKASTGGAIALEITDSKKGNHSTGV